MIKPTSLFTSGLAAAWLAGPWAWGANVQVTIAHLYDDELPANFRITNGVNTFTATTVYRFGVPLEWDEWDAVNNEWVHYVGIDPETAYTTYGVTVPDAWIGYTVASSWDSGATWTAFTPIPSDANHLYFQNVTLTGTGQLPGIGSQNAFSPLNNLLLMGRWTNSPATLFTYRTWDNANPSWPSVGIDQISSHQNAFWRWMHPTDSGTGIEFAMDLDHEHRLTVRKRGQPSHSHEKIVIDPESGSITIRGSRVLTHGDVAFGSGASAQMTRDLAFGRSALADSDHVVPPTTDFFGVVAGKNGAVAVGERSIANGVASSSLGAFTLAGHGGSALGFAAEAHARVSLAVGFETFVPPTSEGGIAIGARARSLAPQATALGYRAHAKGYGQTVVGTNNKPVGNASDPYDPQSEVFVVGAGHYGPASAGNSLVTHQRNVLTIKRNGEAHLLSAITVGTNTGLVAANLPANATGEMEVPGQIVLGRFNDDADAKRVGAFIVGDGASTAARSNGLRILADGTLLIKPRGDIPMTGFQNGLEP